MVAIKHTGNIVLTAMLLLVACGANAQISNEKLGKRITVSKDQMRIDSLLDLFSEQTGIEFSFNSKKINPSRQIPVKKGEQTLAACLSLLQRKTGIHYAAVGNHIILIDNPPAATHELNLQVKASIPGPGIAKTPVKKEIVSAHRTTVMNNNALRTDTEVEEKTRIRPSDRVWVVQNVPETVFVMTSEPYVSSAAVINKSSSVPGAKDASTNANAATGRRVSGNWDRERGWSFTLGTSISKPDVYPNIIGTGMDAQFEYTFNRRLSFTASLGYNLFIGKYHDKVPVIDSSEKKNFFNLPLTAGLRYYFTESLYISAGVGEAFGFGKNSSHILLSPAAGYIFGAAKFPIDLSVKYTRIVGGTGIPESTALQKGEYNILSFRIAIDLLKISGVKSGN